MEIPPGIEDKESSQLVKFSSETVIGSVTLAIDAYLRDKPADLADLKSYNAIIEQNERAAKWLDELLKWMQKDDDEMTVAGMVKFIIASEKEVLLACLGELVDVLELGNDNLEDKLIKLLHAPNKQVRSPVGLSSQPYACLR